MEKEHDNESGLADKSLSRGMSGLRERELKMNSVYVVLMNVWKVQINE